MSKTKKRNITKKEEIELLEQLKQADSYFRNTFSEDDISQMQQNIKHDFPIMVNIDGFVPADKYLETLDELNETFAEKKELSKRVKQEQEKAKEQIKTEKRLAALSILKGSTDYIFNRCKAKNIIKLKIKHNINLSQADWDYIEDNLK